MLFSGAFSGAFFCAPDCAFFNLKIRKSKIHQVCALDCAGSLGVCAVFWCFFWCSFLKTVVLFLCSGLCWEFGSLCCFLVFFLVLLFENSCAFFVLWIVLGVWKFVLFSGVFSGAFFCAPDCAFFKLKNQEKQDPPSLCSGLCWEVGSLCCFLVLFLVLLFENSCPFFVLWIVLGVWEFVLFSGVFSGAPF